MRYINLRFTYLLTYRQTDTHTDARDHNTFPFWNKSQLQLNEVCHKVSLTENFHQQSCSTLIPRSNGT